MPKQTTKKSVARKSSRAKQPPRRELVRRRANELKRTLAAHARASLRVAGKGIVRIVPTKLKHPLVRQPRTLHPYIRTMFLSLAAGTLGVIGSTLYYVHVAEATKPFLEARALPTRTAVALSETPFLELVAGIDGDEDDGVALRPPPKEYLRRRAEAFGYDAELLDRIAYCESRWRMIQNRTTTAYGYFQIVDGTERMTPQYKAGLRKTDPYANIDMALYLYGRQGTLPWLASRRCWAR